MTESKEADGGPEYTVINGVKVYGPRTSGVYIMWERGVLLMYADSCKLCWGVEFDSLVYACILLYCIHVYMYAYMYAFMLICMHKCIQSYMHMYTCTRTHACIFVSISTKSDRMLFKQDMRWSRSLRGIAFVCYIYV